MRKRWRCSAIGCPTTTDLTKLRYTSMVVEEVMRMYPPVWILPRLAQADDEVGGYHVPAGADVVVSPYTHAPAPSFWPDPERFDPERFAPEAARPDRATPISRSVPGRGSASATTWA